MNLRRFVWLGKVLTMSEDYRPSLKRLLADFPPGAVLPTRWLTSHGYADNLLPKYVAGGWLASVGYGVYQRPGALLRWTDVVLALQDLLALPVHVGGRAALNERGYSHFLPFGSSAITLYGPRRPPKWTNHLDLGNNSLEWHPDRLFRFASGIDEENRGLIHFCPEQTRRELLFASEERAYLEFLDEVPHRVSVNEADLIMQGLTGLRPQRVSRLLAHCRSFKVKRLFLALAHRQTHAWLKYLDLSGVDLGKGKRSLEPGGRLDARFLITLPKNLDADHE